MKTTGDELRSEATMYAEGTPHRADELVAEYSEYVARAEQDTTEEPVDFQRWIEREYPKYC